MLTLGAIHTPRSGPGERQFHCILPLVAFHSGSWEILFYFMQHVLGIPLSAFYELQPMVVVRKASREDSL